MNDQPSSPFDIQQPLGYEPTVLCNVGHPVVYSHIETKQVYIPLRLAGQVACTICIAMVTGVTCKRPHMAFEIGVVA